MKIVNNGEGYLLIDEMWLNTPVPRAIWRVTY